MKYNQLESLCEICLGEKIPANICNAQTEAVIIPADTKLSKSRLRLVVEASNTTGIVLTSWDTPKEAMERMSTRICRALWCLPFKS